MLADPRSRAFVENFAGQWLTIRKAATFQPDLLAMGTHARSGIAIAMVGSLAREFLIEALCDVLVVRA
jgi:nucleotide-binding universal stress UspA family protein